MAAKRAVTFRRNPMIRIWMAALLALAACGVCAKEAAPASNDPAIEARMLRITSELRCLVCQNQTIADSHADLAEDLREEVRVLLRKGQSDQQVVDYMTARYGDFVLYRPTVQPKTWLLWFGPAAMMIGGGTALALLLRRRARLADDQFEPDADEADEADESVAALGSGGRP
jgi:cytochrome c-type biogenesis protein CcmH